MKRRVFWGTVLLGLLWKSVFADCYISVDKAGSQNAEMLRNQAETYLTQFVEPVKAIPLEGISAKACLYKVSLMENREGFFITISGGHLSSDGFSEEMGFRGVKQAMLRAIYKAKPEKHKEICNMHPGVIPEECGISAPKSGDSDIRQEKSQPENTIPDRPRVNPCGEDIRRICDYPPGEEQLQCLRQNFNQFSPECRRFLRNRLKNNQSPPAGAPGGRILDACREDIKNLCLDFIGDKRKVMQCMRSNRNKLSNQCRKAISFRR